MVDQAFDLALGDSNFEKAMEQAVYRLVYEPYVVVNVAIRIMKAPPSPFQLHCL